MRPWATKGGHATTIGTHQGSLNCLVSAYESPTLTAA